MFRNLFVLLIIMFLPAPAAVMARYDMSTPVEGSSVANDTLQFDVMRKMYENLSVVNPACYDYSIKNTQLLHYPYDVKKKNNKYVKGYWKELWTVNVCGTFIQIPVSFYIEGNKTEFKTDDYFLPNP